MIIVILDPSDCDDNNGGCEQECINTIGSYICACRDNFVLGDDGKSCIGKKLVVSYQPQ